MNNEKTNFTPRVIGLPDAKKEKEIIDVYSEICRNANALYCVFEYFLSGESDLEVFFNFIKSKDPKWFLYYRYIEINGIQFPGLSIDKIIQLDLVDVNKEDFETIQNQRAELIKSIEKTKELHFFFPLAKLFHQIDEEIKDFGVSFENPDLFKTPEFDAALYKHVRKYTFNEQENQVLDVVESAVNALNDLIEFDIIRNEKQKWEGDINELIFAIEFTLNSDRPLSVDPNFPKYKGFRKWFEDRRFIPSKIGNTISDILSTEEHVFESFDEIPGNCDESIDVDNDQSEDLFKNEDTETEQTEANQEEVIQTE